MRPRGVRLYSSLYIDDGKHLVVFTVHVFNNNGGEERKSPALKSVYFYHELRIGIRTRNHTGYSPLLPGEDYLR